MCSHSIDLLDNVSAGNSVFHLNFPNAMEGEPIGPASGLPMDGHGGHHDAGDYNRFLRTLPAHTTAVVQMGFKFELSFYHTIHKQH